VELLVEQPVELLVEQPVELLVEQLAELQAVRQVVDHRLSVEMELLRLEKSVESRVRSVPSIKDSLLSVRNASANIIKPSHRL
jgi:hypothetical protein